MDIGLIKDIPRRKFPSLLPKYQKGTHFNYKGIEEILIYKKAKKLTIYVNGGDVRICTDGEITRAEKVTLEMIPGAVKFAVPAGAGK
jgi:diacylglycerol kinase family enzyme